MNRALLILIAAFALLPAASSAAANPVPLLTTFSADWTGAEHYLRDPAVCTFRGKIYLFFESDDPSGAWPGYHGNLYYRTYEESGGLVSLSDVVALTPSSSPFEGEHRNEKALPIVFDDHLWLFWHSADRAQVPNGDVGWVEILGKSFDGKQWSDTVMLNSPVEPYNASRRGCNEFPYPCQFNGKLYVVWERNVQYDRYFYSDIWLRAFDGDRWGPAIKVSEDTTTGYNEGPSLGVFGNRLHIIWERVDFRNPDNWKWELLERTYDGENLGPVSTVAVSSDPGYKDAYPRIVQYYNPSAQRQELYAFWRVMGVPRGEMMIRSAIGYAMFDGTGWNPEGVAAQISKSGRASGIGRMGVTVHRDRIYLAFATTNDAVKIGEDFDIVYRTFDGKEWSVPAEATLSGDEAYTGIDTRSGQKPKLMDPSGLPVGFSPLEDWRPERMSLDNNPQFVEYRHRLYMCWRMIPDFNFYGRDILYLRVLSDRDTDGDAVLDTVDQFPENPSDWKDTDRDGVGDNTDPSPYNPDIWQEGERNAVSAPPSPAAGAALVLIACAAGAYYLRPSVRRDDK